MFLSNYRKMALNFIHMSGPEIFKCGIDNFLMILCKLYSDVLYEIIILSVYLGVR